LWVAPFIVALPVVGPKLSQSFVSFVSFESDLLQEKAKINRPKKANFKIDFEKVLYNKFKLFNRIIKIDV